MGSTAVVAYLCGRVLLIAHVGDSRAYLFGADGTARQLTQDHSLMQEMIDRGEILQEQSEKFPYKNLITRAVGTEPDVLCDIFTKTLAAGDFLLLCTDGLSSVVTDQEMLFEVVHGANPDNCCRRLLAIALAAGAPDNVTMALIRA